MLGAVAGDIMGSPFEFNNTSDYFFHPTAGCDYYIRNERVHVDPKFTDDSVLTLAVAHWLMTDSEHTQGGLIRSLQNYGRMYPRAGYGPMFRDWLKQDHPVPNKSFGNGAAMRVSPVGLYAETKEECLALAELTAKVSHDHPEAIKGAQALAYCVWLAKRHHSKDEIKRWVEVQFGYDLDTPLAERTFELKGVVKEPIIVNGEETGEFYLRDTGRFDASCQKTVPAAIRAFLEGENFESVTRKAVAAGGDSDTIAAMAASIADPFYGGVPEKFVNMYYHVLDPKLAGVMNSFETYIRNGRTKQVEAARTRSSNIVNVLKYHVFGSDDPVNLRPVTGYFYFADTSKKNIVDCIKKTFGEDANINTEHELGDAITAIRDREAEMGGTTHLVPAQDEVRTLYYEGGSLRSISSCESYGSGTLDSRLASRDTFLKIRAAAESVRSSLQKQSGYEGPYVVHFENAAYPSIETERVDIVRNQEIVDTVMIEPSSGNLRVTTNEVFRSGMSADDIISAMRYYILDEGKVDDLTEGEDLHIQVYDRKKQYMNIEQAGLDVINSKDRNLVFAVDNPELAKGASKELRKVRENLSEKPKSNTQKLH